MICFGTVLTERGERMAEWIVEITNGVPHTRKMTPLVRCKDCEYWQDNNGGYPHEECRWGKDETPDPDDYCSFGRRKR